MNKLSYERHSYTENFTYPERGSVIDERNPTLIWIPEKDVSCYTVKVFDAENNLVFSAECKYNFANIEKPLESGDYSWTVDAKGYIQRERLYFSISENAIVRQRPSADELFDAIPNQRPRHLFYSSDIDSIKADRSARIGTFMKNLSLAKERKFITPPDYPDDFLLDYRLYFGYYRDAVDRDLVALALGYSLFGDEEAGALAKKLLLSVCRISPYGEASPLGLYGDEVGLSNSRCLPSIFDMLYPLLDKKEIKFVGKTVAAYAAQCAERIKSINYEQNPSNSHVGRIPAYVGEAAMVLKGEGIVDDSVIKEWLSVALSVYNGIFPFYGCADGSWAEGTFYSTSYTKWYIPFFSAVYRYTGKDLSERPFYHRYVDYLRHFADPSLEIHPFADGYWCLPDSTEFPGFYADNPYRYYAELYGTESDRQLSDRLDRDCPLYSLHLLDLFLPKREPKRSLATGKKEGVATFPHGGFAAVHQKSVGGKDISLLVRASKYGSDSHRHADQGSFALFYDGKALISPSGYFGAAYGSAHHFRWTNTTKAHNVILVDGKGQPEFSMESVGRIIEATDNTLSVDLSEAYPSLSRYERRFTLKNNLLTVTDTVEGSEDFSVTYPLHTLSAPEEANGTVRVERGGVALNIIRGAGLCDKVEISDEYDVPLNEGIPEHMWVSMPKQYHVYYKTEKKGSHIITVEFAIEE